MKLTILSILLTKFRLPNSVAIVGSTAVANLISKGLQFLLVYQAFALARPYLGVERFGIFSTILGYGAFLSIMDLGIGNVLIGSVARAKASHDPGAVAQEIRCGIGVLTILGMVIGAVLALIVSAVPMTFFFAGLDASSHIEVQQAMLVFLLGYACTLPAQGIVRILQGLQKAYWAYGMIAVAASVSMLLMPLAVSQGQSISFLLALAYLLPAASPLLLLPFVWRSVQGSRWDITAFRQRLPLYKSNGGIFFLLQLGALAAWGLDAALVASYLGPTDAGQYAIVQRLFQLVSFPLAIVSAPLWPIYAQALARSDNQMIRRVLRTSMSLSSLISLGGVLLLVIWHREIIALWLGPEIVVLKPLIFAYAVWTFLECIGNSYAMFLNGLNLLKLQLFTNMAFFALAIPLKLTVVTHLGMAALPVSASIAYLLAIVLPYALFIRPHRPFCGVK